jgi:hypothetical protein
VLPVVIVRDLRLDLIRGLALWLIFLDHIPSNIVSWITIRNYGFSDAAEIFVFISGYANTYFHGEVARQHGLAAAAVPVLKRAWQLYAVQILLFAIYVGVVGYLGGGRRYYADETNIAYFLQHPDVLMLQALLLKFKPVNLDPLPLYFVLMLVFPVILWLLGRLPIAILTSSVVLYVLAKRWTGTCRLIRAEDGISIRSPGSCCSYSGLGARSVARTVSAGSFGQE